MYCFEVFWGLKQGFFRILKKMMSLLRVVALIKIVHRVNGGSEAKFGGLSRSLRACKRDKKGGILPYN